ncbi:hypothetical protein CTAYLR_004540 [Chrysophaeum taylorii]|uniref:DAPG hydrolase PhiG domain-containing protein n=1 Tax=Chrysophaeum taylorii TaxID=2483200 RepID=A0AAD7XRH6_9STRA|nr:hypothetical protein CTAYLR_004540 [Chrysophaeum taylorii]
MSEEEIAASKEALAAVRGTQRVPGSIPFVPLERMKSAMVDEATGVGEDESGQMFVSCSVSFPGCSLDMLRWWFCEGCKGSAEYRRWHPGDHFECHWSDGWYEGKATVSGEIHFVKEALGADRGSKPMTLRIQFRDPPGDAFALCARVGVKDAFLGWLDVGHFVHYPVPTPDGFELRSRFWLGDIDLPHDSRLRLCRGLVKAVANTRAVRAFAARVVDGRESLFDLGRATYRHATEEFSVLATFLADAYAKRAHLRGVN